MYKISYTHLLDLIEIPTIHIDKFLYCVYPFLILTENENENVGITIDNKI